MILMRTTLELTPGVLRLSRGWGDTFHLENHQQVLAQEGNLSIFNSLLQTPI